MRSSDSEREDIRAYFEMQDYGEPTHLEKVASDRVGSVEHDIGTCIPPPGVGGRSPIR